MQGSGVVCHDKLGVCEHPDRFFEGKLAAKVENAVGTAETREVPRLRVAVSDQNRGRVGPALEERIDQHAE